MTPHSLLRGLLRVTALASFAALAWIAVATTAGSPAAQTALAAPKGKVILTITGTIAVKNATNGATFDLAMLDAMPKTTIKTATPWTEGRQVFEGVALKTLIATVGGTGGTVRALALNNYAYETPLADMAKYGAILAHKQNGKDISVREKGPLWIIFPLDDFAEIHNIEYHSRMVWQIKELQIK
ncbi:MAG: hypothetical protein ACKVSF_04365 [Alphaproteobacteria bacterium]